MNGEDAISTLYGTRQIHFQGIWKLTKTPSDDSQAFELNNFQIRNWSLN